MKSSLPSALLAPVLAISAFAQPKAGESPADHLPPHIVHLTSFGERADWSADGKKILFLSKTFGDALEIDVATREIRNLTAYYPHHGYTRALYLANGDVLLSGPETFDPKQAGRARNQCYLSVLPRDRHSPPAALGVRCNEGPAVSRRRLHIAWPEWTGSGGASKMFEADVVYSDGRPALANRREILDVAALGGLKANLETQNFRAPEEKELTFSIYTVGAGGSDVGMVDLATGKVTRLTATTDMYDEPEGIFPDGKSTLVECDQQNKQGSGHVDLWKLALDGSGAWTRITYFSDYPGYKASNPVVSDDGRFIAFQMAKAGEAAGVGHGIFILDLAKAPADAR